jgi:CheY-like chemotaxis protein
MDGRATVLVFGDNTAVLELIDRTLSGCGHRVLTTSDPSEALEVGRRVKIDVLVSDVVLGGPALARELVAIQSRVRVLYMFDLEHPAPPEDGAASFVRKPVGLPELEAAVAAVLDPDD